MEVEVGVDVGGEAAGGAVGGDPFAAAARRQAGDGSAEAVVAVRGPNLGRDQSVGHRGLDRSAEPCEIDPAGNGVGDISGDAGPVVVEACEPVGWAGGGGRDVEGTAGVDAPGATPDAVVGSVDEPVAETGPVEVAVEDDEGEVAEGEVAEQPAWYSSVAVRETRARNSGASA